MQRRRDRFVTFLLLSSIITGEVGICGGPCDSGKANRKYEQPLTHSVSLPNKITATLALHQHCTTKHLGVATMIDEIRWAEKAGLRTGCGVTLPSYRRAQRHKK